MATRLDYTIASRRFAAHFPMLSVVAFHVSFWVIAYGLLYGIVYMSYVASLSTYRIMNEPLAGFNILPVFICSLLYGTGTGILDYFLERKFLRNTSLGRILAIKATVCVVLMTCCFLLLQYVFLDLIVADQPTQTRALVITGYNWQYLFLLVLAYTFFMTLIVNFVGEVDKKFGPGVLLPLLLGKYRQPKEEERIFMFMDLKSSTSIAEKLGHITYSSFISDCFMDINHALFPCNAEVYQYVGDEIVVSWPATEGLRDFSSTRFFFACEAYIQHRAEYYLSKYGIVPVFKAGMHMGTVTAVEIGEVKRDIAYHGDTLNTAARIQGLCNQYQQRLLVSGHFFERSGIEGHFPTREIATIVLKGKSVPIRILSIETREQDEIEL